MIWVLAVVAVAGVASRHLLIAVPLDVALWVAWLYVNPFTDCSWCSGKGKHPLSSKKTYGRCWNPRCSRGSVQRAGSKTVHRAVRALVAYRRNR